MAAQKINQNQQSERQIILVGKTGNGKSSTGNSLLQKDVFLHKISANAVTETCMMKSGINFLNAIRYKVVDTPGLLDTSKSVGDRALDIQKSLEICRNPHAFLLVFSANNRMTTDEQFTIDMFRIIFGEEMFKHSIVVFTHGEKFESEAAFEQFWTENAEFAKLISLCENRVAKINNETKFQIENEDRECIIKMIEDMSHKGQNVYIYKHLNTHREVIEKHSKSYSGTGNVHEEVSEIVQKLGKKLDPKVWKIMLYGGTLIGGGAFGAGYLARAAGAAGAAEAADALVASEIVTTVMNIGATVGCAVLRMAWKFW